MHYAFHDFIGNIGLVLLLGTYLLLQMGKIDSTRPLYSLLNALAALLIGAVSYTHLTLPTICSV